MNLKPCPFCGGNAEIIEHSNGLYRGVCLHCPDQSTWSHFKDVAAENYNNRPGEREVAKQIVRSIIREAISYRRLWDRHQKDSYKTQYYKALICSAEIAAKEGGLIK